MFGLPVHSTRRQAPRVRPSRTHTGWLAGVVLLFAAMGSAQDKPAAPVTPPPPDNKPAEIVGSATCQMCHEDIFNAFQKNPHQVVETDKKRGWETKACESCHGPGSKHAESVSAADIKQPAKLKASETNRICLTCHQNQATHVGRLNSSHDKNQVSCTACHSIHKNGPHGLVARKPAEINAQCADMPHRRLGELPAPVQTPPARRRHVVRGLPQSARQLSAGQYAFCECQ